MIIGNSVNFISRIFISLERESVNVEQEEYIMAI